MSDRKSNYTSGNVNYKSRVHAIHLQMLMHYKIRVHAIMLPTVHAIHLQMLMHYKIRVHAIILPTVHVSNKHVQEPYAFQHVGVFLYCQKNQAYCFVLNAFESDVISLRKFTTKQKGTFLLCFPCQNVQNVNSLLVRTYTTKDMQSNSMKKNRNLLVQVIKKKHVLSENFGECSHCRAQN